MSGLAELLRDDVVLEMPPLLTWFAGRADVARFLAAAPVFAAPGQLRLVLVRANGQPAFAAYQREAEDAVADSYAVAVVNGLRHDRHAEELNVQTFIAALRASIDEFLADPLGTPLVPNWSRVWAGAPDAGARLLAAVEASQAQGLVLGAAR